MDKVALIMILLVGFCFGNIFQIIMQSQHPSHLEIEASSAITQCQSQSDDNVRCKITAIPYEMTVRID